MHPNPAKETTSVKVILEWAKEKLLEAQVENPMLDARLLLGFALGTPQERFYGSEDKILTKPEADNYTKIIIDFEVLPNDSYYINITPNAIVDLFQKTTDSLKFTFKTKKISEYGKIFFNPIQKNYPLIIDLINMKGEVVDTQYLAFASENCFFENIVPGEYNIRVVEDKNENKKRDTGNFLEKIQPEKVYFNNEIIKVRANWIIRESF